MTTSSHSAVQLRICVFCAANDLPEKYTKSITDFAELLGSSGHKLIYGGSSTGIMNLVATTVQKRGGKVVGVPFTSLVEGVYEGADEIIMTKSIEERKATMLSNSDAIIVLVGGSGTLDETTEVIELKRHGMHGKPIVILNSDNFYENLRLHYQRIETEGLLSPHKVADLVGFVNTPQEAIDYVERRVIVN